MRITKSLLFSILFLFVIGSATANTDPTLKSARTEIKEMIMNAELTAKVISEITINVTFHVNAKNQIVVISTDNESLDKSLKSALNYKALKSTDMRIGQTYTLPIKLTK